MALERRSVLSSVEAFYREEKRFLQWRSVFSRENASPIEKTLLHSLPRPRVVSMAGAAGQCSRRCTAVQGAWLSAKRFRPGYHLGGSRPVVGRFHGSICGRVTICPTPLATCTSTQCIVIPRQGNPGDDRRYLKASAGISGNTGERTENSGVCTIFQEH